MAKRTKTQTNTLPTAFEQARNELFHHVIHCGVTESDPEHHDEWFDETMRHIADRYPELNAAQLKELRVVGERFSRPAKRPALKLAAGSY